MLQQSNIGQKRTITYSQEKINRKTSALIRVGVNTIKKKWNVAILPTETYGCWQKSDKLFNF